MTDRMSNVEIEDVLSSIRRLVSDELRPMTPARKAQPRLVLTPALRVDLPTESEVAPSDPPDELAARLAELELMLDAQDQPFEPESEDLPELSAAPVWQAAEPDPIPEAPFVTVPETAGEDPAPEAPPVLDWIEHPPVEAAEPAPEDYRLLDEAVLRDLIRDVLREELQGGMGERVTRNLRKMVRSELARALTARGIT